MPALKGRELIDLAQALAASSAVGAPLGLSDAEIDGLKQAGLELIRLSKFEWEHTSAIAAVEIYIEHKATEGSYKEGLMAALDIIRGR